MELIVTVISSIVVLIIIVYIFNKKMATLKKRAELMVANFPEEWSKIIDQNMAIYHHLPKPLQKQLKGHTLIFLEEKAFQGYQGVEITDEIRVTIAAQASLLMLNRKKPTYYPKLWCVAVFPEAYIADHTSAMGNLVIEGKSARLGESWNNGKLLLAWSHTKQGKAQYRDGQNLVVHEFAHQLDQEDGEGDGVPILSDGDHYAPWAKIFTKEYLRLVKDTRRSIKTVMDRYGATNPAEFFAVASETFFEKGKALRRKHPELYEQLKTYYKVDPASWM